MTVFEENIAALGLVDSALAQRMVSLPCALLQGIFHKDAYLAASKAVAFPLEEHEAYLLAGTGAGYHLNFFADKIPANRYLWFVEPREDIFRMVLEYVNLTPFLKRKDLKIFIGSDELAFSTWLHKQVESAQAFNLSALIYDDSRPFAPSFYKTVEIETRKAASRRLIGVNTLTNFGRMMDTNLVANLPQIQKSYPVANFTNCLKDIPAVIIGAGPSLEKSIDSLHRFQGKAFIISISRSLRLLLSRGIIPNLVVQLDMIMNDKVFFDNLTIPSDTTLLYDPDAYCGIIRDYPHRKITYDTQSSFIAWKRKLIGEHGELSKGSSVAHTAFFFARLAGCNPIILTGIDLAFPQGQNIHALGTNQLDETSEQQSLAEDSIEIQATAGGTVRSLKNMQLYISHFEEEIAHTPGQVINTSAIGALIKGTTYMAIKDVIEKYCDAPKPIHERFESGFTSLPKTDIDILDKLSKVGIWARTMEDNYEAALTPVRQLSYLDPTNKFDVPRFNKLAAKINQLQTQLTLHDYYPLLSRILSRYASVLANLRWERNCNPANRKLEIKLLQLLLHAHQESSQFLGDLIDEVVRLDRVKILTQMV